jgi:LmbE family N-acetylglucosaminyl deacetylase
LKKNSIIHKSKALAIILLIIFVAAASPARAQNNTVVITHKSQMTALDRGAVGLGQAINRLGMIASVLHTGAHPDDEDSGLLAYLARGRQARTAYLSLTRGDGGQNLIGPELYESLGVIRTDEMLAARRLDGASQFFTRAFDFGFSKVREEALSKWDKEAVLSDMVRVIRTFRPFVIVSVWTGTPSDGHGHHQAAGLLSQEAYMAAADPARFTELGLKPWKAKKLYIRARDRAQQGQAAQPSEATLSINTGQFDPVLGRTYYEIAMQGRSQHRSQDQGALERREPRFSRYKLVESSVGSPKEERDIFEGVDATIIGIADFAGSKAAELRQSLTDVQRAAEQAKKEFNPYSTKSVSETIASGLRRLREIRAGLQNLGLSESEMYEVDFLLDRKEKDFADALAQANGVVVDCLADDDVVTPGQTFNITVAAYASEGVKILKASIPDREGMTAAQQKQESSLTDGRAIAQTEFKVSVAERAEPTAPYWLKQPRRGAMFEPGKGGTGIEPHAVPAVEALVEFEIEGQRIAVARAAEYRFADKALGEIRYELKIAPILSLVVSPAILISPVSNRPQEREVTISMVNNSKSGIQGSLTVSTQNGGQVSEWAVLPKQTSFDLKREGERASFTHKITVPANSKGNYEIKAIAQVKGERFSEGYQAIAYPHTQPRFVYREAKAAAGVFDVKVAPGLKVGFIEGAGDDFANALKRLGVDVAMIESRDLASGDLSKYDVIVMGLRVYEVRPDVVSNNRRLLEYVHKGGTLIVQYNKGEYAQLNMAPYAVKMKQTPERVTDERAAVELLDPTHPIFNYPNRITESDFEGWVQERGTYFLSEWDSNFKPLIASHDPGEAPLKGGQLIAQYGKGQYIYTGIAWFRQLPEGVPGAYRLIANLVSLPKAKLAQPARARTN